MRKISIALIIFLVISAVFTVVFVNIYYNNLTPITDPAGNIIAPENKLITIENEADKSVIIIGFGNTPWIVKNDEDTESLDRTNDAKDAMLLSVIQNGTQVLYYKTIDTELRIENAEKYSDVLARDGKSFIYTEIIDDKNVLKFYRGGEIMTLSENAWSGEISPNGTAVTFSEYDTETGRDKTYIYLNGKTELIGDNISFIWAIADNADFIYYQENDGNNYVQKGLDKGGRVLLCKESEGETFSLDFNYDYSQVGFVDYLGNFFPRTYISINGNKPKKINDKHSYVAVPYDVGVKDLTKAVWTLSTNDTAEPFTIHITENLFGLYDDFSTYAIADTVFPFETGDYSGVCLYRIDGNLYKTDPKNPESVPFLLAENVGNFILSENEEKVFVINDKNRDIYAPNNDGKLFCISLSGEKTVITDSFDTATPYGNFVYYLDKGTVYRSDGTVIEKIGDLDNENIPDKIETSWIEVTKDNIIVVGFNYNEQYYICFDGENFYTADEIREIYGINSLTAVI
jgi:hypothetical protein